MLTFLSKFYRVILYISGLICKIYYIISTYTFLFILFSNLATVWSSTRNFASCINIDRVAPKTSKTEALCPINRQSMFVNLKADEESFEAFIFPACFPSGQQYFYFLLGELQDVTLRVTISAKCLVTSYSIIFSLYIHVDISISLLLLCYFFYLLQQEDFCANEITGENKSCFFNTLTSLANQ